MKASLRATLTDGNWIDSFHWVLLARRSTLKEDPQSSSAVHPQCFNFWTSHSSRMSVAFLLQFHFPVSPVVHSEKPTVSWQCVCPPFTVHRTHCSSFWPSHKGLFRMLEAGVNFFFFFVVDLRKRKRRVSLDCLKAVDIVLDESMELAVCLCCGHPLVKLQSKRN